MDPAHAVALVNRRDADTGQNLFSSKGWTTVRAANQHCNQQLLRATVFLCFPSFDIRQLKVLAAASEQQCEASIFVLKVMDLTMCSEHRNWILEQ